MKLFEIKTNRAFYIITIFGIKISIKSTKLLQKELNKKNTQISKLKSSIINDIKSSIKELKDSGRLKEYNICFLNLIHSNEMELLYKYFNGYNFHIIQTSGWAKLLNNITLYDLVIILSSKIIVTTYETKFLIDLLFEDQILINLWHACGAFKKIGFSRNDHTLEKFKIEKYRSDYFITSGKIVNEAYSKSFQIDIDKFISLGVSRTDNLFNEEYINNAKINFYNQNPELKDKRIYFYCPTFREENNKFVFNASFDLLKLSQLLENDEVFIFKLHPLIISRINNDKSRDKITNMQNINNNILDFSEYNILDLLIISDVIMTDYSSAFMEGLLLNKPIVFAASDIDDYERGFFIDYRKDLPGEIVESNKPEDILEALRNATIEHPNYQIFKENHIGSCDGKSSERIANFIKDIINENVNKLGKICK